MNAHQVIRHFIMSGLLYEWSIGAGWSIGVGNVTCGCFIIGVLILCMHAFFMIPVSGFTKFRHKEVLWWLCQSCILLCPIYGYLDTIWLKQSGFCSGELHHQIYMHPVIVIYLSQCMTSLNIGGLDSALEITSELCCCRSSNTCNHSYTHAHCLMP